MTDEELEAMKQDALNLPVAPEFRVTEHMALLSSHVSRLAAEVERLRNAATVVAESLEEHARLFRNHKRQPWVKGFDLEDALPVLEEGAKRLRAAAMQESPA